MTTEAVRTRYVLKGCQRCNGDIVPDEWGDRRCLQCGGTVLGAEEQAVAARILAEDAELLEYQFEMRRHHRHGNRGASHKGMRL